MGKHFLILLVLAVLALNACMPSAVITQASPTTLPAATKTPLVLATRVPTEAATPEGQVTITAGSGCTVVSTFNFPQGDSPFPVVTGRDWSIGRADAAVTILEYSDFM